MPLTKYFCRNGYTMTIGSVATIVAAMRIESDDTESRLAEFAICCASDTIFDV
ncbi:hypothetical protein D3C85_1915980 [compost metagenome]